jgi:formate dehydrogenase major subunit
MSIGVTMLIKHSICPSCSVGCGINLICIDNEVVGTYPYKRHPINEGKNCSNGKNSYKLNKENSLSLPLTKSGNKLKESEWDQILSPISEIISSYPSDEIGILSSGKITNEEAEIIRDFAGKKGIEKIGVYSPSFPKINNEKIISNYDELNNASFLFIIGDIFSKNPLIGRRIAIASDNGTKIFSADDLDTSITAMNSDNYFKISSLSEFLNNFPKEIENELNQDSVIIFNELENKKDFEKIVEISKNNSKILPVLSDSNSYGTMQYLPTLDNDELIDLIDGVKVLFLVENDISEDFGNEEIVSKLKKLDHLISLNNSLTEPNINFDYILPIPNCSEKSGTFTNTIGKSQSFEKVVENENVHSIEKILNDISKG